MADLTISARIQDENSTSFFSKVGGGFTKLAGLAATIGAAMGIAEIGKKIVEVTSNFEKYNAVLTNTFQNSEAAAQAMTMIRDIAAKTPFSVDELTNSYVKLANRGFAPTRKEIIALGDLASSTGKSFDQLVEAMLDAETNQFERLKEFGIKAKKVGNDVELTFKGQTTVVKKSAEEIRKYLISLGDIKGVAGGMSAISSTLGGAISNLGDAFDSMFLAIGTQLSPVLTPLIQNFTLLINDYVPKAIQLFKSLKQSFVDIASSPIGTFITDKLIEGFKNVKYIVFSVREALINLYDKLLSFYESSSFMQGFVESVKSAFSGMISAITPMFTFIRGVFNSIVEFFLENPIGKAITETILTPIKWVMDKIGSMFKWLGSMFTKLNSFFGFSSSKLVIPEQIKLKTGGGGNIDLQKTLNTVNSPSVKSASSNTSKDAMRGNSVKSLVINIGNVVENMPITQYQDPLMTREYMKKLLISVITDLGIVAG
jgi:hypothetical protein